MEIRLLSSRYKCESFGSLSLSFRHTFIGTASEFQNQPIDEIGQLFLGNRGAIIETQRNEGCEFHLRTLGQREDSVRTD